jgi:hypothetical protein
MFIRHPLTIMAATKASIAIRIVSGGAYGTPEPIANRSAIDSFGARFVEHCNVSHWGW